MSELEYVHHAVRKLNGRRVPLRMKAVDVDHDTMAAMQQIALNIFTDSSNMGHGFADALTWVYLSGLQHGAAAKS